jgi:hypothetical protein
MAIEIRASPMPRPQFTLRALLVLIFGAACCFGWIRLRREYQRREEEADRRGELVEAGDPTDILVRELLKPQEDDGSAPPPPGAQE